MAFNPIAAMGGGGLNLPPGFGGGLNPRPTGFGGLVGSPSVKPKVAAPSASPWDALLQQAGGWNYENRPALGHNPWGGAGTFDNAWFRWGPIEGLGAPAGFYDQIAEQTRNSLWEMHKQLPSNVTGALNPDQAAITYWKNRPFNYSNASMNPAGMAEDIVRAYMNQAPLVQQRGGREWTPPNTPEYRQWRDTQGQYAGTTATQWNAMSKKESALKKFGPLALSLGLSFIPGVSGLAASIGKGLGLSGVAANVAGNVILGAGTGGLTAGISGGDIGKGLLTGALGGGLGAGLGYVPGFSSLPSYVQSALKGAAMSGISGGDPLKGALAGGLGGLGGMAAEGLGLNPQLGSFLAKQGYGMYRQNQAQEGYQRAMQQRQLAQMARRSPFPQRTV